MSETGTPKEILNGRATEFEGVCPILRVGNVAAHLQCSKRLDWCPSAALRIGGQDAGVRSCRPDRSRAFRMANGEWASVRQGNWAPWAST